MTPDDIFAAHMWPWPDPLIKRDANGGVLFVNAAFLQLYGGRVEDWRGNVVSGWPAPNIQAGPHRFETRMGQSPAEAIYDWLETPMADGTALAIARNVTVYMTAPSPEGGHTMAAAEAPVQDTQQAAAQAPAQAPVEAPAQAPVEAPVQAQAPQAPAQTPAQPEVQAESTQDSAPATPEHSIAAPVMVAATVAAVAAPVMANAAPDTPVDTQPDTSMDAVDIEVPELTVPDITMPMERASTEAPAAEQTPADVAPTPSDAPSVSTPITAAAPAADEERDETIVKRPLPIEADSAVLGANWRDAVIAKAVGAAPPAEKEAAEPSTSLGAQAQTSGDAGGEIRILLAEDNAINALLTRTLLEADGCIVDTVEDGALALEAVKKAHYDLIFMDMRMPNMDGLESTRKIRALGGNYANMPIIALTANAFDDDRNACFDSGMNDFMTKPVSAEELSEMTRTWTKNREQRKAG